MIIDSFKFVADVGGGTSPGTTSLVAWYDFDNSSGDGENDSHSGAHHLTEDGPPTYTTGAINFGSALRDPNDDVWTSPAGVFAATNWDGSGDYSIVVRLKLRSLPSELRRIWFQGGRLNLVLDSSNVFSGEISNLVITGSAADTNWVTVILDHDSTGSAGHFYINDVLEDTVGESAHASSAEPVIGGQNTSNATDVDFDFVAYYNRLLTDDERTWLNVSRAYSQL